MGRLLRRNIWIEAGISLFLMLFFIYFYCHIDQWVIETLPSTISPAFFPSVVTLVLIIMSALLTGFCLRSVRHMLAGKVDEERLELQEGGEEAGRFAALAGYVGILFLYLIGLHFIGFVYSTPIVMFLVSLMLGLRHWLIGIVCYVLFTLLLNYVAFNFMQIILPTGVLFGWPTTGEAACSRTSVQGSFHPLRKPSGRALGIFTGLFRAIPGISGIMAISILLPLTATSARWWASPCCSASIRPTCSAAPSPPSSSTPRRAAGSAPLWTAHPSPSKGGQRLNAALVGSVFGDTFSNILLICVAAPLSYLTLKVGPVEQCSLILLALTVVGSISGSSILKGILCAGVGILLATVGVSGTTGAMRFTFENENLMSGIALIPMVIGLLCLPEVIHQACSGIRKTFEQQFDLSGENGRLSWQEIKSRIPVLLVPDHRLGHQRHARPRGFPRRPWPISQRTSKHPEKFGKGAIEGVMAPEAANNAVTGSAMIPLLTLGIPGDDVTAVLMGAFLIQGITPGPNIFFENTTVVYGIFGSLIMCDILLYVIAKLGFRVWVRITQLPKHIIFSTVTIFAFVGTYSINQNLFDILCLILFGILGYGMRRFQFPAGPMIIGFILGPLLESAFDQTMTLSDGSFMIFLTHPFSVVLLLLTVAAVFSIARARLRRSKIAQLAQEG
ncbi:MAG: tripartite tricarboxylate transporter permease [Bilophila wadsworthia]